MYVSLHMENNFLNQGFFQIEAVIVLCYSIVNPLNFRSAYRFEKLLNRNFRFFCCYSVETYIAFHHSFIYWKQVVIAWVTNPRCVAKSRNIGSVMGHIHFFLSVAYIYHNFLFVMHKNICSVQTVLLTCLVHRWCCTTQIWCISTVLPSTRPCETDLSVSWTFLLWIIIIWT